MTRILAVADEQVDYLLTAAAGWDEWSPELILGAGDLPYKYLAALSDRFDVPCVYVPGNHDPSLREFRRRGGVWTRAGVPDRYPGVLGGVNADGRVVSVGGLRIAGLGGSVRYRPGPNQLSQRQALRRVWALRLKNRLHAWRNHSDDRVDVLLTHSPAAGFGDEPDPAHRGLRALARLVTIWQPALHLHGHIHPHGRPGADLRNGATVILNTVGYSAFDLEPGGVPKLRERRHGA